uniref:Uncharacterized protein n=1 Tax=Oryza barthii TaxID=65489 RepID=A0A0D3HF02_9ORYZ
MTPTILAALSAACVKPAGKALPEKKLSRLSFSHSLAIMPRMCSSASLAASPGFSLRFGMVKRSLLGGALLLCADKIKDVIHNVDKGGDLCELNPQLVQLEVCKSKLFHCSAPGGQGLQVAEVVPGLVLHQADMVGMFQ